MAPKIETETLSAETLLNLGFIDVASWKQTDELIAYELDGPHAEANRIRLDERNALYAFVRGEDVLYIGKTARTIRRRFTGYLRPGKGQATNIRCNKRIKDAISRGEEVRVFIFNPISHLRYGVFDENLAAGLEDALIEAFDPPWNGHQGGQAVTEEAEREEAEIAATPPNPADRFVWNPGDVEYLDADGKPMSVHAVLEAQAEKAPARFNIVLGEAYYRQGLINPGVEASQHLGGDGEPIEIVFSHGASGVTSRINRTANRTGSVRVVGRNREIATWFQAQFAPGDTVRACVLDPHRILLLAKDQSEAEEPKQLEGGRDLSDARRH